MTKEFLNLKDPFDEPKEKKKFFAKPKKKVIGKRLLKATYRLHKDEHGNAIVHYLARRSLIYNEEFSPFYDVEDFNIVGSFQKLPIHWATQFGTNSGHINQLFEDTQLKLHQDVKGKNMLELAILNTDEDIRCSVVKGLIPVLQKFYSGLTLVSSIYKALAVASRKLKPTEETIKTLVEDGIICSKKAEAQKKNKHPTITSNTNMMFAALRKLGDNLEFEGTNILHLAVKDATEKKNRAETENDEEERAASEEEGRKCVENILRFIPVNSKQKIMAIKDENQNTPLHIAVGRKDLFCVKLLIKDYSRLLKEDTELAKNILVFAAKQSTREIYDILLSEVVDVTDNDQKDSQELRDITDINYSYKGALEENNQQMVQFLVEEKKADVNFPIGSKSGLEVATEKGYGKIVDFLLKQEGLNWKETILKESRKENLFHQAIKSVMPNRILSSLLKYFFHEKVAGESGHRLSEESQICHLLTEKDSRADTPLHLICQCEETDVRTFKLLLGLYKKHEIDLAKLKNAEGQTPLHLAAKYYRKDFVEILSEHRSFKDLMVVEDNSRHTTIQIVSELEKKKEKKAVADEILNILLKSSEANSGSHIHNAARYGAFTYLDKTVDEDYLKSVIDNFDLNNQTPLYVAVDNGQNRIVEYLLKKGADVTIKVNDKTALQLAIEKNNKEAIEKFIDSKSWLNALRTGDSRKQLGPDKLNTPMRDLIKHYPKLAEKVLNKCHQHRLNLKDNNETNTFIFELLEDTQLYIEDGKTHTHIDEYQRKTKMRRRKVKDNQFEVPYTRMPNTITDNHPLMIVVEYKQKNLLSHRIVQKLINYKWNQFAAIYYYINLIFYAVFLVALTVFVMTSNEQNPVNYPELYQCSDYFSQQSYPSSNVSVVFRNGTDKRDTGTMNFLSEYTVIIMAAVRIFVFLVGYELRIFVIKAIKQTFSVIKLLALKIWYSCRKSKKTHEKAGNTNLNLYILMRLEWATIFDIATYILALVLVIPVGKVVEYDGNDDGIIDSKFYLKTCWQWQLGAFLVTLAWINLLTYMRQIPFIGVYIIILNDIVYTFVGFITVFLIFIMGFTSGFYLLLRNEQMPNLIPNFQNFGYAMMKTMIMMSGEYDYTDIFYGETPLPFPAMSYILFNVFFILLSIILINLLVGLTVSDVNIFVEIADLKKMSLRLKFILNIEEFQRNNLPQQILDFFFELPKIGFIFGPLRTILAIILRKKTTPREFTKVRSLVDEQNKGKMWKQVITEKVYDDRKQDIIDLKRKTTEISETIETNDEKLKKKINDLNNNFNDKIDRIEEITNEMNQFLSYKNESSKAKAEKKKTMLKNLQKDFTSYEADYIFNEREKDQRMEALEIKIVEMEDKIDEILSLLRRRGPDVEDAPRHQHGRDCDERYCSQPLAFHI